MIERQFPVDPRRVEDCSECEGTGIYAYETTSGGCLNMHCHVCGGGPFQRALRNARYFMTRPENKKAGGNLHLVLCDANLDDHSLAWSSGYCSAKEDYIGGDIMEDMLHLTMDERYELLEALRVEGVGIA